MIAGTMVVASPDGREMQGRNGIFFGHMYTLLDVVKLDVDGKQEVLFKLRNPWGTGEWYGKWGDSSRAWSPEMKKNLDVEVKEDGVFYMAEKDFFQNFDLLSVCYAKKNAKSAVTKVEHSKGGFDLIEITVDEAQDYLYFQTSQSEAEHSVKGKVFDLSPMRIVVAKEVGDGKYKFIGGDFKQ